MRGATLVATLLLAAGLAGCLGADEVPDDRAEPSATPEAEPEDPALEVAGEACSMAGAQSVHPREGLGYGNLSQLVPEPWTVDDVLEDTGPQYTYSQWPKPTAPVPEEGDTWGHYHGTVICETWTVNGTSHEDVVFGFVGAKVKTPSFVDEGADDAYLATVVATNDEEITRQLQAGGVDAMHANATVREEGDQRVVSMVTDHNGEYLSVYRLDELGPVEDEHVRLWFQHENTDGTYSPLAVDLTREGGTHYGDQGEGYFHHQATAHHWPLPGAYGKTAAAHYEGFDLAFEWGPRPDATLETAYVH